jgi:hypothetical protein
LIGFYRTIVHNLRSSTGQMSGKSLGNTIMQK